MSSRVATVIPEMGLEVDPISPVRREETVTNRKPKQTISSAPIRFMCRVRAAMIANSRTITPPTTKLVGRSRSVRGRTPPPLPLAAAALAARISERPPRSPCQIIGSDWTRLIIPPVATAPAPM